MFEQLTENLRQAIGRLSSRGKLTPEIIDSTLREIRRVFLAADVNYKAVSEIINQIAGVAKEEKVLETLTPEQTILKIVRDQLTQFLGSVPTEPNYHLFERPIKVMLVGLQGSGKTTAAAKLGVYLKKEKHFDSVLLVACDTVRPAAVRQLQILAQENGLEFIGRENVSAIENAKLALQNALNCQAIIFDTQGRLHIDEEMLEELRQIKDTVQPSLTFLVIDSMYGQEALNVADRFNQVTPLDGIILTKLDGDAKGGAALSAKHVTGVPIVYVSTGEKASDFEIFRPERFVARILGMGDVLSLIEKAEKELDRKKAEETQKKLMEGKFDLNDYLAQLQELKKLGGFQYILEQLPHDLKKNLGGIDDSLLKKTEAIILSMTPEERSRPEIINCSRRERIARGSGTTVQDVNQLLKSYYEMKKLFKQAKKLKKRRFGLKLPF
jgi:signal recognition particle subunit SRP54